MQKIKASSSASYDVMYSWNIQLKSIKHVRKDWLNCRALSSPKTGHVRNLHLSLQSTPVAAIAITPAMRSKNCGFQSSLAVMVRLCSKSSAPVLHRLAWLLVSLVTSYTAFLYLWNIPRPSQTNPIGDLWTPKSRLHCSCSGPRCPRS